MRRSFFLPKTILVPPVQNATARPFFRFSAYFLPALLVAGLLFVAACDSGGDGGPPKQGQIDTTADNGRGGLDARADIFAAGRDEVPSPGGGQLPERILIPEGVATVTFPRVEGTVKYIGQEVYFGPDGIDEATTTRGRFTTNIAGYEGISGIRHDARFFFLVGVFLTDQPPSGAAPERLNVTGANSQIEFDAPEIGQVFFIGDGQTDSGALQRIGVPETATRLYVGFADAETVNGETTFLYSDNDGRLSIEYRFIEEPEPQQ